ncbi:multidrug effflux MFS transporter [Pedobacter caeni]|uniref:Drug resistance transporter, Bcr/CflA subfamily n=1 Tax=Pedobacter caeni TaxID=288992 RepID=A0A1M4UGQ5_9SPHI|nr:multidrug effflux MFS transporter [Pedobacter caeni]SHE55740.1 drug resistance transporter, Bcr/CflA subfamily [Pedobacter caeni]
MKKKPNLLLLIVLIMFPQFVETIYSPALPDIAREFRVSSHQAALTISIYFIAFAIGVICWGILSDVIGRKKSMVWGLVTYGIGAITALLAKDFNMILVARVIAAFGAAVGSIITQTILRDIYEKEELSRVFSIIGISLSISPVIGFLTGGIATKSYGYSGVFMMVLWLAIVLIICTLLFLPETKRMSDTKPAIISTLNELLHDKMIWISAFLVAFFNIMLFSYYSIAPFLFDKAGYSAEEFGYSGILLAIGSLGGGVINKKLIYQKVPAQRLIFLASVIALLGGVGVLMLQGSLWFLLPTLLIVIAFGIAIPNILSQALIKYKHIAGTAGAIFGLMYYVFIGLGLTISGLVQNFGLIITVFSLLSVFLITMYKNR